MDSFEVALPRERSCGTLARRLIERRYGDELDSNVLDDLKLVVTDACEGSTHVWAELPLAQPNIASKSADTCLGQPE